MTKKTVRPIKWHGGKSYLARWIIGLMPPHTRYCEPYFGGGAVLFNKPCEGVSEYVNDINGELTNFWRVLQGDETFAEFRRVLEFMPLSDDEFRLAVEESGRFSTECQNVPAAIGFFIRYRQSRQALGKDYVTPTRRTRRGMNEQVSAWLSAVECLPEAHERLRRVEVWTRPAIEVIDKLDSPDTLFYMDPPYLHSTRTAKSAYEFEMSTFDHACLLARLCDPEINRFDCFGEFVGNLSDSELDEVARQYLTPMHGKFLLSGHRSGLYGRVSDLHAWAVEEVEIDNKASGKKAKDAKTEIVWRNFHG